MLRVRTSTAVLRSSAVVSALRCRASLGSRTVGAQSLVQRTATAGRPVQRRAVLASSRARLSTLDKPTLDIAAAQAAPVAAASSSAPSESKSESKQQQPAAAPAKKARVLRDRPWLELVKARLNGFVIFSAGAGYMLGGLDAMTWTSGLGLVLGTALSSFSASAFNQIREREFDAQMKRTRNRPLVTGAISLSTATQFAWGTGVGGVALLAATTNPATALLSAATIGTYVLIYTPMKRITPWNTEIGAIVGMIPPVMGWLASEGQLGTFETFFLASTLFAWQMVHFMALSWIIREDYRRAGYRMWSVVDDDRAKHTARRALGYAAFLAALPAIARFAGVGSDEFMWGGLIVGLLHLLPVYGFYSAPSTAAASSAMYAGFFYLLFFMTLAVFHLRREDGEEHRSSLREWGAFVCPQFILQHWDELGRLWASLRGHDAPPAVAAPAATAAAPAAAAAVPAVPAPKPAASSAARPAAAAAPAAAVAASKEATPSSKQSKA